MESVDVAIVGAGLSGMQAAIDLQAAGLSFVLLEARDRIGGKTATVARPDGKGNQELGPAWLNDTNQARVYAYVKQFGLTPVTQNIVGRVACEDVDGSRHTFPYGSLPEFGEVAKTNIAKIRDHLEKLAGDRATFEGARRCELDALSLEQLVRNEGGGERAVQTVRLWTHGMFGQDPWEISALAFLEVARGGLGIANLRSDGKHGAQYLRLQEGTSAISQGMASLLPSGRIRLNTPVTAILRTGKRFTVLTAAAGMSAVSAARVIISVPGTTYRNIHFDPPLPPARQTYVTATRYGTYVKYLLMFSESFWRRGGNCGLAQSFRGPASIVRDTSVDAQDNYALTCFIGARPGREWLALSPAAREDAALAQVAHLFDTPLTEVRRLFVGSITSPWMDDRWAGYGCPFSMPPPGGLAGTVEGQLSGEATADGRVFVGTESTDVWRGYMEGALSSGARGAGQVVASLAAEATAKL